MKKQIRSIIFGIALFGAAQLTCMQQEGNNYVVYNITPDATISIAGMDIGPNTRNMQINGSGSDQIQICMANKMAMAFRAPGSFLITLTKMKDPECPELPIYRLILLNRLTQQIAANQTISPAEHVLTEEMKARLVEIQVEPRRVGAPVRMRK